MTVQEIKQALKKLRPTEYNLFVHPSIANQIPELPENVHLIIGTYVSADKAYLCEVQDLENIIGYGGYRYEEK